eukprot:2134143-Amphidinium_carterae.1
MFRNDKQQRDIRELQDYLPQVITFLEAWENVLKNHQPPWYQAALAKYNIVERLQWIFFEHGNPKEWISPLPDVGMQVIFAEDEAPITANTGYQNSGPNYVQQTQTTPSAGPTYMQQAQTQQKAGPNYVHQVQPAPNDQGAVPTASSAGAAWQSYTPCNSKQQENADPAASSWQKPSQSSWQLNSGPQNWSAQSQAQSSNWQGSSYHTSNAQQPYWSS